LGTRSIDLLKGIYSIVKLDLLLGPAVSKEYFRLVKLIWLQGCSVLEFDDPCFGSSVVALLVHTHTVPFICPSSQLQHFETLQPSPFSEHSR
jgi:hypothetical protein